MSNTSIISTADAASASAAFDYAASQFTSLYNDGIQINITLKVVAGTGTLGGSNTPLAGSYTYLQVKAALIGDASSVDDATFNATLPATDPTGNNHFYMARGEAKALGLIASDATLDGTFTFGAGFSYSYDPNNRAVAGEYDFIGIAMHEISEIMGRIPGLGATFGTGITSNLPYDLCRFTAAATRNFTNGNNIYFSLDNGTTNLKNFNFPNGNGSDPQDWASGSNDAFNAFANTGVLEALTPVDKRVMDVIGYNNACAAPTVSCRGVTIYLDGPGNPVCVNPLVGATSQLPAQTKGVGGSCPGSPVSTGTCDCPPGYVATGYQGQVGNGYGNVLSKFRLKCRAMNPDGTMGAGSTVTCDNGTASGSNTFDIDANSGEAIVGFSDREGCAIDRLGGLSKPVGDIIAATSNATNNAMTIAGGNGGGAEPTQLVPDGYVVVGMQTFVDNASNCCMGPGASAGYAWRYALITDVMKGIGSATAPCGLASANLSQSCFNCSDAGTNTITLTVTDQNNNTATCQATVTVIDTVMPTASSNSPLCTGAVMHLFGSSPRNGATYSWTGPNGFTSNQQNPSKVITTADAGTYTVTVTSDFGCQKSASTNVTVDSLVCSASSNSPVFNGNTIMLFSTSSGSAGPTYAWTGPNGFTSTNQNPTIPNATAFNAGVYTVVVTSAIGCTCSSSTIVVVILTASKDAFLRDGADNTNEGANPLLRICASGHNRAIVAFDLTGVSLVDLTSAELVLTIDSNVDNWGGGAPGTRWVDVCRVTNNWIEGNGWNDQGSIRGTGHGVTWNCFDDANIVNSSPDGTRWNGGNFDAPRAPGVLHYNGLLGEVSWDVTADMLATGGAPYGWIIKKRNEGLNGRVFYKSKENTDSIPKLVLTYNYGLHKKAASSGIKTEGIQSSDRLIVFPNPAREYFTLQTNNAINESSILTLQDITGKVIINTNLQLQEGVNNYSVNIAGISEGMYIVSLQTSTGTKQVRLEINR